jgi:CRP-like cAMP-binding protein
MTVDTEDAAGGTHEVSVAFRDALWVSRCVGRAETTPLRPADVDSLARYLRARTLQAGEPLHQAGTGAARVCILREGCLELVVPSRAGRVVIQTMRPGDVDGDIQLLLGIPMPYETRAASPSTCLLLEGRDFEALLAEHPHLSRRWLTSVSERLARSHARLTSLLGQPLEVQLAQLLLDESDEGVVSLPQTTLAGLLGARRQSVNRTLGRFQAHGLLDVGYGRVAIVDRAGLEQVAGGVTNRPPAAGS